MSSTSLTTVQLIIDALADYAAQTGIDLSRHPFAEKLQQSDTPDAILELLQEREKAFKEYRDGNRTLINCLNPTVRVLHVLSATLGEAVSLVPFSPAKAVFVGVDVLLGAAIGISSSYDALLGLFECLGSFLKRLEIYTDITPTPIMMEILVKIMAELLSVLALATKQIKQGRFKKFTKKLLGESEVEAVLQRLDRLTQDEARMTVAQTLSVVHGLVNNMKVVMEDGKVATDGIRQTLFTLQQIVDEVNKIKRDQFQRDVRLWLSPPDPSTNHRILWKGHHKGTGRWFFESSILADWKSTGSLLWIHGKPGCGKSTLLSSIIQDIEHLRAAGLAMMGYYYFDFRDVKKQDIYGLLSSLLSQLSAKSDACYEVLSQLYSDNIGGIGKPDSDALTQCFKDVLCLPGHVPIYIIIDALDECPNVSGTPSAREEVLGLLRELVDMRLPNVYLCVASRPEVDIRRVLECSTSHQISLHDETGQKEDIIKYIQSFVHSDWNMRNWRAEDLQLVIDVLSERADGMFRWIVCQLDRLRRCFPSSIRSILDDLPEGLDETYGRTLLGIDKEKREYAQRLFRCMTVSIRPLRVEELAEIFSVRFDGAAGPTFNAGWRPIDTKEAVLSACSTLIAIVDVAGSQVVQFAHFSVKEFLISDRLADAEKPLSCYHIDPEVAHTTLAFACLSVLLQLDDQIDRDGIRQFPLAQYAAQYWIDHARFRNVSSEVQELMERLFDPMKPHFASWVWLYDVDHHWLDPMSETTPTRPSATPLYYASLCGFRGLVEHCVTAYPQDINATGGFFVTPLRAVAAKGHVEIVNLLLDHNAELHLIEERDESALHLASWNGHIEVVKTLLDRGVDVNQKGRSYEWTALHYASSYGRLEIAHLLVQRGAIVGMCNSVQDTPLHFAARSGQLEIARLLLNSGASTDIVGKNGLTPLHWAANAGNNDIINLFLGFGASLDARDSHQETPLSVSCRRGRLEASYLLLDHASDVNARNYVGGTPLHAASEHGHLDITRVLIQHGADVDGRNNEQETPLGKASSHGHIDTVSLLTNHGADVSSRDIRGWAPLHSASYRGHLDVVKFLLECGVEVDIRDRNEKTSLDLASGSGNFEIVQFLIERGADIHTTDIQNWNPLHVASQNGHVDVVRLLIDTGVAVDIRNETKATPLALASSQGKAEVSLLLIERGADMNARDNEGWAPLHHASRHGHADTIRLLLDHGVDPNILTDDLWTPLHLSSAIGNLEISRLLVQHGATVDAFNDHRETPLNRAAGNGDMETVYFLVDNGANLHTTDDYGCTPLHSASRNGHMEVVKLLLGRGADVDVLSKGNKTAAALASEHDQVQVAEFLATYMADASVRNSVCSISWDIMHSNKVYLRSEAGISLHTALEEGNVDVVKSLLDEGADINARDAYYTTPIYLAAEKAPPEVMQLLLERGAEVDPRGFYGFTPLVIASREGKMEVSRLLIDHGANVNARTCEYWTPIHYSAYNGHLGVVELLLKRGADAQALNDDGHTAYQLSLRQGYRRVADILLEHGRCLTEYGG